MFKKLFGFAAIALLATLACAGVASAQDAYPTPEDGIDAVDTTVAPGGTIVLGIQVCAPGTDADFTLDSSTSLGSATASSDGRATLNATIPSSTAPGSHTITGACTAPDGSPLTLVLNITITGAAGTGSGALPTTGSDSAISMTQIALAAVVGGGLLVLAASKRRANATAERETASL